MYRVPGGYPGGSPQFAFSRRTPHTAPPTKLASSSGRPSFAAAPRDLEHDPDGVAPEAGLDGLVVGEHELADGRRDVRLRAVSGLLRSKITTRLQGMGGGDHFLATIRFTAENEPSNMSHVFMALAKSAEVWQTLPTVG